MKRRDLMTGSLKVVAASPFLAHALAQTFQEAPPCAPCAPAPFPAVPSPDTKLRVKPIMTNMIHSSVVLFLAFDAASCLRESSDVSHA